MMDETRFKALAEAYGGALVRWPEAERGQAERFLAEAPDAARPILAEAAALDLRLDAAGPVEPDPALYDRVQASAARARPAPRWAAVAAAVTLMVGTGAGWMAAPSVDPYADPAYQTAFTALEDAGADTVIGEEAVR